MIEAEQLHARILEKLDLTREVEDEELTGIIYQVLQEAGQKEYIPLKIRTALGKELFNAFRKLDLLQDFLEDDEITEVMINGVQSIFYEKHGKLYEAERHFLSREKLEDVIQQIVAGSNRIVNEASPIVDARLPDGSRVNVVLAPVALNGPIVTIRKFPKDAITMEQLIAWDSVSEEVTEFLAMLVVAGYNIFISGGTGSGKTTFLNALQKGNRSVLVTLTMSPVFIRCIRQGVKIMVVLIGLVLIFKSQLTSLVETIFEKITSESSGI